MKKMTLALAILISLGLSACAQQQDENSYQGTVLFSQYKGKDLKLTIRKDNCEADKRMLAETEDVVINQPYNSNIVVGACVAVSENGVKNISRSVSSSVLSRTSVFK